MFFSAGGLNGDGFFGEEYSDDPDHSLGITRCRNTNYYHKPITADIVHQTEKAYLLRDNKGEFWVPKKLALKKTENTFMLYGKFRIRYLENSK